VAVTLNGGNTVADSIGEKVTNPEMMKNWGQRSSSKKSALAGAPASRCWLAAKLFSAYLQDHLGAAVQMDILHW
jgi:hypothetical protein